MPSLPPFPNLGAFRETQGTIWVPKEVLVTLLYRPGGKMSRPYVKPGEVEYPETDGKPMAETDCHRDLMVDLIAAARYHFRNVDDVYVSGNLFVYFVEGDPRKSVAPDFFVVRGVPKGRRRTFKIWEEGRAPEVVIELTSRKTHREDLHEKRPIYEQIGVLEYYIFDPHETRFQPQLQGFCLKNGVLQPVAATQQADGTLVFSSTILGLELHGRRETLRLVNPLTQQPLPTPDDFIARSEAERRHAEDRVDQAEKRAMQAEHRAKQAEERTRQAEQQAREERDQRESASAEVDRLREELERLRRASRG